SALRLAPNSRRRRLAVGRARLSVQRGTKGGARAARLGWPTTFSRLLLGETPVDCFDEAIRRPGAPRVAVPSHVSFRRLGCLYFGERSSRLHQIADPVSDDRHHVPILDDVQLIAEATVPGDDDRARLARHDGYRGYGQIDETIERR